MRLVSCTELGAEKKENMKWLISRVPSRNVGWGGKQGVLP